MRKWFCCARRLSRRIGNKNELSIYFQLIHYSIPIKYIFTIAEIQWGNVKVWKIGKNAVWFETHAEMFKSRWVRQCLFSAYWWLFDFVCFFFSFCCECVFQFTNSNVNYSPNIPLSDKFVSHLGRFAVETNCSCFYTCDKGIDEKLILKLHQCPGRSLYSPKINQCSYSCNALPTEVKNEYNIEPNERDAFPPCSKPGQYRYGFISI